jgi:hypothetical protein
MSSFLISSLLIFPKIPLRNFISIAWILLSFYVQVQLSVQNNNFFKIYFINVNFALIIYISVSNQTFDQMVKI